MMKIMISNICSAFENEAVGSKVKEKYHSFFMKELEKAILNHDWNSDRVKGQAVLDLPNELAAAVWPGNYFRPNGSARVDDFVLRVYPNRVGTYLKRTKFMKSKNVSAVVYTRDGYRNDPDFDAHDVEGERFNKFFGKDTDGYVLVAVLANPSWSKSTVSYSRFVKNLAGANNEYAVMSKDEVVDLAKKVVEHNDNFMGVAD